MFLESLGEWNPDPIAECNEFSPPREEGLGIGWVDVFQKNVLALSFVDIGRALGDFCFSLSPFCVF